ncbi:MAG: cytochrome c biogenesis heme-transporting ATPase CcmA [Betaproteobacteria bacterium]|nr:cytochrome c biogenesis heme-transporting ATPase CcmA [Betaproteobacteria bacterium]
MLEVRDLACWRGDQCLFDGLDVRLGAGEVLWIEGANGSGKTSLMRILCGLSPPERGEIRWKGRTLREGRDTLLHDLMYLGHLNALKDDLTVAENLDFHASILELPRDGRLVGEAIEAVGLTSRQDLPVRVLSQGQRRRAALARLWLATDRPLWILDEPFAALDTASVDSLSDLVASHVERGHVVVLSTHQEVPLPVSRTRRLRLDALSR